MESRPRVCDSPKLASGFDDSTDWSKRKYRKERRYHAGVAGCSSDHDPVRTAMRGKIGTAVQRVSGCWLPHVRFSLIGGRAYEVRNT